MNNKTSTNLSQDKKNLSFGQKLTNFFSKNKKKKNVSEKVLNHTEEYLADYLETVPRKVLSPQEAIKIKSYERLNSVNHLEKYLLPASPREDESIDLAGKLMDKNLMGDMIDKKTADKKTPIKSVDKKKFRKSDEVKKSNPNLLDLSSPSKVSITEKPTVIVMDSPKIEKKQTDENKIEIKTDDNVQTPTTDPSSTSQTTESVNKVEGTSNDQLSLNNQFDVKEKKDLVKYYKISKQLAKTNFSTVHLASIIGPNTQVAIKEIHLSSLPTKELEQLSQEKNLLLMLKHPYIIDLMSVYEIPDYNFLVFEYCRGGDLFDRISTEGGFIELRGKKIMKSITETIAFLHKNRVCHRDLKPENILLVNKKKLDIKLCDFGIACKIPTGGKMNVLCGSRGYFAPEVMLRKPYDEKVDMFSLGVVCFAVLAGYQPFYGETDREMIKSNLDVDYDFENEAWEYVSNDAKDFISKLLQKNLDDRLSSEEALVHPWFLKQKKDSK
eukprot:TRINITY_DN6606_c0_g1_i1.p1 TRINITY_DN6606_c0_g1~~TRINITY_DN6606_c0_g1_i1.p1  ORF type:complete len:496 (-),score=117.70 TRINITY_DN6606_c0_g1_i1:10-1497(-)